MCREVRVRERSTTVQRKRKNNQHFSLRARARASRCVRLRVVVGTADVSSPYIPVRLGHPSLLILAGRILLYPCLPYLLVFPPSPPPHPPFVSVRPPSRRLLFVALCGCFVWLLRPVFVTDFGICFCCLLSAVLPYLSLLSDQFMFTSRPCVPH